MNRYLASDALERSRAAAQANDLPSARQALEAVILRVQSTPQARSGDSTVLGYVQDMQECLRDLRDRDQYQRFGSKKMAFMSEAHSKQRSCTGSSLHGMQLAAAEYSSMRKKSMGMTFSNNIGS